MTQFYKSFLTATIVFMYCPILLANTDYVDISDYVILKPQLIDKINNEINKEVSGINVSAIEKIFNDANFINDRITKPNDSDSQGYDSSSITGTINGHAVRLYTTNGTPLGHLGHLKIVDSSGGKLTTQSQQIKLQGLNSDVVLEIDGKRFLDTGQLLNRADAIDLARVLGLLPSLTVGSPSLDSTSASSNSSQLAYSLLETKVLSRRQAQTKQQVRGIRIAMADLKYEQARFTDTKEDGDIKGVLMALSTEINDDIEIGAYIPYDYLSFKSFSAHRTGTVLYAKHSWQLPSNLQLTALTNFNYMATYLTNMALANTFGGGVGTSLGYDDGGDFVPKVSFSFQYNQDDYDEADSYMKDNHQYLVKMGASLGYRLFENGTLTAGFTYTRDITSYKSLFNKAKDDDYFDLTVGGSYTIADMWQVNLSYKRILGLNSYYSNAVFLGTSIGF